MALQLPPLPSFNVQIPDLQAKALEGAQLRNMLSEQALRNALAPSQIQTAQAQAQQAATTATLGQMQLESNKKLMDLTAAGFFDKFVGKNSNAPEGSAFDATGATAELAKNGIMLEVAQPVIQHFQNIDKTTSEIAKNYGAAATDFLNNRAKAHSQLAGSLDDAIRSENPAGVIPSIVARYLRDPQGLSADEINGLKSLQGLRGDALVKTAGLMSSALNLGAEMDRHHAETAEAAAKSQEAQLKVAAPSDTQLKTFTGKTIPSFTALRPEQKNAFIAEAQGARTVDELDKVKERADATDKAEQMHKDSLAQTVALKETTFAQQGLKENDKTWTDPQHGFLQVLTQANLGKAAIKAGADGNGLLTSLEPTMVALGVSSFAGVHRVPPAEAQAAGAPGGWAERFNAWATKAATGKLSKELATEGQELFDDMIAAKHQSSVQASAMHAVGYNIPQKSMPAMDRDGNLTTLDKVGGGKAQPKTGGIPQPPAATMRVPGSDGHMHWSDGKADLGRAD